MIDIVWQIFLIKHLIKTKQQSTMIARSYALHVLVQDQINAIAVFKGIFLIIHNV